MTYDDNDGTAYRVRRALRRADRFDNYRPITARFPSTGNCGHPIAKGDVIGWSKRHGCKCASCWSKWTAENQAAEQDERMMAASYGGEFGGDNW